MSKDKLPLHQIAKALSLSPATVSLVLHNRHGVSEETRLRVQQMLRENGYQENVADVSTKNIHLFKYSVLGYYTGKSDGYINAIFDAITLEARARSFGTTITSCHEGEFQKTLSMIMENPLDGMVLMGTDLPLIYGDYFREYRQPLILVDTYMAAAGRDSVVINNDQCIAAALQALKAQGHTRIGYIHSCYETFNYTDRIACFGRNMERCGLKADADYIFPVNLMMEHAFDNVVSIMLLSGKLPSAIIADNDTIAVGMLNAFKSRGLCVPEELSIIGIGDTPICKISSPSLTVVQVPAAYIGRMAVQKLQERMLTPGNPICLSGVSGDLISRESVALCRE